MIKTKIDILHYCQMSQYAYMHDLNKVSLNDEFQRDDSISTGTDD